MGPLTQLRLWGRLIVTMVAEPRFSTSTNLLGSSCTMVCSSGVCYQAEERKRAKRGSKHEVDDLCEGGGKEEKRLREGDNRKKKMLQRTELRAILGTALLFCSNPSREDELCPGHTAWTISSSSSFFARAHCGF